MIRSDAPSTGDHHGIAQPPAPFCDLCGEACEADDFSDMAGLFICRACIETELEAMNYERSCQAH